ncbi:Disulphide bond corrector protein DsbC [Sphingobacterium nematocida]|uniref:Disulphide bond corrector protein DsbC n=1 Tax=Sphingobacterium nematocida TaxID=1513896 RepID=A0A1T5GF14_9SPHI|nr:protein-disulfide reductase DsbD N-terminal domain-containing protein [Sphingobacterium nematocida]SKC06962.1 Disulphide bond corrector protein DsbC [Sphingobacterium nematocida]
MKATTYIYLFCFLLLTVSAVAQKPRQLKVLYVGGSANWEKEVFKSEEDKAKDIARRKASFEVMLKKHFSDVTVIDAKDYKQSLSDSYDVTVMDGTPPALSDRQIIRDAEGKVTNYLPASYLTEDFARPMLFIGELGERMGRSIGLKMDWYCLCLDAHAHHYKKEHPIFKGPFKVRLTEQMMPTPTDALHYAYFSDTALPKEINMWRVQTKGYVTDQGFRVGMVARPWGFEDSPDAESISSGVCQKTLDAVAIARHGNFFHWGFAASPEYMTDEANTVLANAVVYISTFKSSPVIARKYTDRRATKLYLKEKKYYSTREAYDESVKMNAEFEKQMLEQKAKAEAKKSKNEALSEDDKMYLNFTPAATPSFEEFLKKYQGDLFDKFGTDSKAYGDYYDQNWDYFYSEDASYVIKVDEDVKSLGIPNTDIRLLDKCIQMLEKNQDIDKAKRILSRYTLLQLDNTKEWRNWFEKNKEKLFFTQSGGFYFMLDTKDKSEPTNQYKRRLPETPKQAVSYDKIHVDATSHDQPVRIAAAVIDMADQQKEVVVKVKIHPGYHIYAAVSGKDPYIKTELSMTLPTGINKKGDLVSPSFHYFNDKGTTIYKDEIVFKQAINGSSSGKIKVEFGYQCCDSQICFPPATEVIELDLTT